MLSSILLGFFATKTYGCLVLSLFTGVPRYFSAHFFPDGNLQCVLWVVWCFPSCYQVPWSFISRPTFFLVFLSLLMYLQKPFLLLFYIFLQIQLNMNLAFATNLCMPKQYFYILPESHAPVFPSCMLPFNVWSLSGIQEFFIMCRPPPTATWLSLCWHVLFLSLEKVIRKNLPGLLVHSSHQGCIPFLENPLTGQSLLYRSSGLVTSLFPPLVILNCTHPNTFAAEAVAHIQLLFRSPCLSIRSTW